MNEHNTEQSSIQPNYTTLPELGAAEARLSLNEDRFWKRVAMAESDACWPWKGYRSTYGQVRVKIDGKWKLRGAHQVAYVLTHGPMPADLEVLHSCDNPLCCNPRHLSRGTRSENLIDAARKGRFQLKERQSLTIEQVRQIKMDLTTSMTCRAIAAKNNTTPQNVNDIKHGKSWAQVQI